MLAERAQYLRGFRLLFSFHSYSVLPEKLPDGEWNCTVPFWPGFKQHLHGNIKVTLQMRSRIAPCESVLFYWNGWPSQNIFIQHREKTKHQGSCFEFRRWFYIEVRKRVLSGQCMTTGGTGLTEYRQVSRQAYRIPPSLQCFTLSSSNTFHTCRTIGCS